MREQAERHYQRAVAHFNGGRYREALDEFDKSLALFPDPLTHCNRGYTLIKLTELDAALRSMKTCRDTFEGPAAEKHHIDAQVQALRLVTRNLRPGALIVAQDIAAGPPTGVGIGEVGPGGGGADEGWGLSDFGYISLGVGGALLASAWTLDWLSGDLVEEYQQGQHLDQDDYQQQRDEIAGRQQIFWTLAISGSALAAAGLTLLVIDALDSGDEGTSLRLNVGPQGAALVGSF